MKRKILGFSLIVLGILAFLQSIDVANFGLAFWPVLLLFIGICLIVDSVDPYWNDWAGYWTRWKHNKTRFHQRYKVSWVELGLGLWVSGIGLYDILRNANVVYNRTNIVLSDGWPLLFVGIGISIIANSKLNNKADINLSGNKVITKFGDVSHGQTAWVLDGDMDLDHKVGDFKLDLSTAEITPGEHCISIKAKIGDVVVLVPDNVNSRVVAKTDVGEVTVFGDKNSGLPASAMKEHVASESDVCLNINISMVVGSAMVHLVPPYRSDQ
jgi:predicted membrane protein